MIELYEASDAVRKEREAREEAERKRQEEERRKGERRNRYNAEIDRTVVLVNLAEDYVLLVRYDAILWRLRALEALMKRPRPGLNGAKNHFRFH